MSSKRRRELRSRVRHQIEKAIRGQRRKSNKQYRGKVKRRRKGDGRRWHREKKKGHAPVWGGELHDHLKGDARMGK